MTDPRFTPVTEATFAERVLQARQPVMVKFEADWCGPCKVMAPVLGEIAEEYGPELTVATVDIDQNASLPHRYGVRGVPTMLLFKDGQVVGQKVGVTPKADVVAMLEETLRA